MIYKIQSEFFYNTCLSRIMDLITVPGGNDKKVVAKGILDNYIHRTSLHINLVLECAKLLADHYCEMTGVDKETFFTRISNHDSDKLNNEDTIAYYAVASEKIYGTGTEEWDCSQEVIDRWENVEVPRHWERHSHHVPEHFGVKEGTVWHVHKNIDRYALTEMVADWAAVWLEFGRKGPKAWLDQGNGKTFKFTDGDFDCVAGLCSVVENSVNQLAAIREKYNLTSPKADQSTEAIATGRDWKEDDIKNITTLRAFLSSVKYGFGIDPKDNFKTWKLTTVADMLRNKIGTCYDTAFVADYFLKKIKNSHKCYFICQKGRTSVMNNRTHTFNLYLDDSGEWRWLEASWGPYKKNNFHSKSDHELVQLIARLHANMCKTAVDVRSITSWPATGCNMEVFVKHMTESYIISTIEPGKIDLKQEENQEQKPQPTQVQKLEREQMLKREESASGWNEKNSNESFSFESILPFPTTGIYKEIEKRARLHYNATGLNSWVHIQRVFSQATRICRFTEKRDLNPNEYAAVMFHDSSVKTDVDKKGHAGRGAKIAETDLVDMFTKEDLDDIVGAIAEHDDIIDHKSLTADILASGDFNPPDPPGILNKAYEWCIKNKDKVEHDTHESRIDHIVNDPASVKANYGSKSKMKYPRHYRKYFDKKIKEMNVFFDNLTYEQADKIITEYRKAHHLGPNQIGQPEPSVESYSFELTREFENITSVDDLKQQYKSIGYGVIDYSVKPPIGIPLENIPSMEEFGEKWRLTSPEDLFKYRYGNCVNTAYASDLILTSLNIQHTVYCMFTEDVPGGHMFVVYRDAQSWKWIEASFDQYNNNNLSWSTERAACLDICSKVAKYLNSKRYSVWQFTSFPPEGSDTKRLVLLTYIPMIKLHKPVYTNGNGKGLLNWENQQSVNDSKPGLISHIAKAIGFSNESLDPEWSTDTAIKKHATKEDIKELQSHIKEYLYHGSAEIYNCLTPQTRADTITPVLFFTPFAYLASLFCGYEEPIGKGLYTNKVVRLNGWTDNMNKYEGMDDFATVVDISHNIKEMGDYTVKRTGYVHCVKYSKIANKVYPYNRWSKFQECVYFGEPIKPDKIIKVTQTVKVHYDPKVAQDAVGNAIPRNKQFIRVTYDGIGVYEALKNNMSESEWRQFKRSDAATWLPVPSIPYKQGYLSYFTEMGFDKFTQLTEPYIVKHLDKNKLEIKKYSISSASRSIVYSDKYQIVTDGKETISSESFSMESIPAQYQKLVFENNPVKREIYGTESSLGSIISTESVGPRFLRKRTWFFAGNNGRIPEDNGTKIVCKSLYDAYFYVAIKDLTNKKEAKWVAQNDTELAIYCPGNTGITEVTGDVYKLKFDEAQDLVYHGHRGLGNRRTPKLWCISKQIRDVPEPEYLMTVTVKIFFVNSRKDVPSYFPGYENLTDNDFALASEQNDVVSNEGMYGVLRTELNESFSQEAVHHNVEQHIKDNKVYHCSKQKYDKLETKYMGKWYADKKGIFVTPFQSIASCFVIDKQAILDKLQSEGIETHDNPINFKYDVWDKKADELGTMPKHINVTIQGCTGFEPFDGKATGYLYTIDYSKYQDKTSMFKKSETSDVEFIINSDIAPEKVEKISVEYTVHPGKAASQEAFDASKFTPIHIDKNPSPDRFANDTMKINRIDPSTLNQDIIKVLEKQDEYLEIVRRWLTVPDYSLTPKLIEFGKFVDKIYGFDKPFTAYRAMRIGKTSLPIQQSMGIVDNTEVIKKPKPFVVPGYKFTYMNTGPLSVTRSVWVSKVYGDLIVKTAVPPETRKLVLTNELAYVLQALDEKYPYYRPLNLSALTEVLLFPDQTLNYQVVTTNGDILQEMPEFKELNFKDKKIHLDPSMTIGEEQLSSILIDTRSAAGIERRPLLSDEQFVATRDYIIEKLKQGRKLTVEEIKNTLQPGDIIIPYPKDKNASSFMKLLHAAERTIFGMSFTSCKLVHEKDTVIGYGVKNKIEHGKSAFDKISVNDFLKNCGGLMILRTKKPIPPTKLNKLHEFMERYYKDSKNHDFSYWDATVGTLAYLLNCFQGKLDPKKMDPEDYNKMVCSSVVSAAFRWADIDIGLPPIKINRIMPVHMCMSEKLECVGYWFARGEWSVNIQNAIDSFSNESTGEYASSMEAMSDAVITKKKKEIIDKICKICDIMDPSKLNSSRYHRILDDMTPKEFNQWMTYVKDGKWVLHIVTPNMIVNLRNENLLKAADAVGAKLFHRIWMTDYSTGRKFLTDNEYLVLPLPIRRQQQFLDEKMSVPEDDKHIDGMTGQVTGDSKSTQITTPEINILAFRGLDTTLEEMVNVRGGNMVAYGEFRKQAEETGEVHLNELDPTTRSRTAVIAQVLLQAMHIENNIV